MKTVKVLSTVAVLSAAFASFGAHAGVTTDAHGNVGYDTAEECDAAVLAGTAKFYQTFTHKSPLVRKGEKSVTTAKISDLGAEYARGACDLGASRKLGRDGVSTPLQGKYVPFSPDMPINVYLDANGKATRVSMAQCDNWFSGDAPRAVVIPAPVAKEEAAPAVEATVPAVVAAVPALAKGWNVRPYAFGTIGALNDSLKNDTPVYLGEGTGRQLSSFKDNDTRFAGQVGLGLQFNEYLGAEAFYQDGAKHKYSAASEGYSAVLNNVRNQTYGARLTVGKNFTDNFRLFGKVGAAAVKHTLRDTNFAITQPNGTVIEYRPVTHRDPTNTVNAKNTQTRPTAGLGATYNFNDHFAARVDYDHYFRKGKKDVFNAANYLGAGVQYKF